MKMRGKFLRRERTLPQHLFKPCGLRPLYGTAGQSVECEQALGEVALVDQEHSAGRSRLVGERLEGQWFDIGTPARLAALDEQLRAAR